MKGDDGEYTSIKLDQSDIALNGQIEVFDERFDKNGTDAPNDPLNQPYTLGEDELKVWIADKDFWNHYIVWMSSSATTRTTHLWATIKGGLKKGTYRLNFTQNSAIWTEKWGVKKQVILSTANILGSKGACETMALFCVVFG